MRASVWRASAGSCVAVMTVTGALAAFCAAGERLVPGPVEVRLHQLDARPLGERDEVAGGEHFRHELEIRRFGVDARHRLRGGNAIAVDAFEPRSERRFHRAASFSSWDD